MSNKLVYSTGDAMTQYSDDASEIILVFDRAEVERGLIGDALDRLMSISESQSFVDKFEGKIRVVFHGYDNDPRELYQIPDVVSFFRSLSMQWPFWVHFVDSSDSFFVVLQLLCDTDCVCKDGKTIGPRFSDQKQFKNILNWLVHGAGTLHSAYRLPPARLDAVMNRVVQFLDRIT